MKMLTEEETEERDEISSESLESIHHIRWKNNRRKEQLKHCNDKNERDKKEFIIATISQITRMSLDGKILNTTEILIILNRYQDVNENEVKFRGKLR